MLFSHWLVSNNNRIYSIKNEQAHRRRGRVLRGGAGMEPRGVGGVGKTGEGDGRSDGKGEGDGRVGARARGEGERRRFLRLKTTENRK
uniref:Uncharacterized protein n=1 Tax=viral metagenome TaxID=1070528 RepID=A0A6C0IT26_9ZZZZ